MRSCQTWLGRFGWISTLEYSLLSGHHPGVEAGPGHACYTEPMNTNNLNIGSDRVVEESRHLSHRFDQILSNGSVDVEVVAGPANSLKVQADDNILPLVKTRVQDGILYVDSEGSYKTRHRPRVLLELPHPISAVTLNGSGNMDISDQAGDSFSAKLVGSGNLRMQGKVTNLSLNSLGSGQFDGKDLITDQATLRCMGSGHSIVHADRFLDVHLMGSGDCSFAGNPKVTRQIMGTGVLAPLQV